MEQTFGIIVVGDEILAGHRRDTHFDAIGASIRNKGFDVAWLRILPDDPTTLTTELQRTMANSEHVFCCGGIGMTPDDHTRSCAAAAAKVRLVRHSGAVREIEQQFGDEAYPLRVVMAELPESAGLIPNPVNRIPGFSINHHYFLPGFPAMAHPMAEWVLENLYSTASSTLHQRSVSVTGTTETALTEMLKVLADAYPDVKLFSLPHMGKNARIEVGFRGRGDLDIPFKALLAQLDNIGVSYEIIPASTATDATKS